LPCQQVMSAIANGTLRAAIDTETVQEILHRYGALRRACVGENYPSRG
jgi:hypothetical protein